MPDFVVYYELYESDTTAYERKSLIERKTQT